MHADAIIVGGEHTANKTNSKRNQNERRKRENTFDAGGFSAGHMGQPLVGENIWCTAESHDEVPSFQDFVHRNACF